VFGSELHDPRPAEHGVAGFPAALVQLGQADERRQMALVGF
jgi:hypothetical protein